jgi:hypothetical protein
MITRCLSTLMLVVLVCDGSAMAAERPAIAAVNVGIQAGLTLVRSAIEGRVRNRRHVLRCLFWGGASGAGFYGAKELVAAGNVAPGWIAANIAGSVAENVGAGLHPLAQLGYSIGPVRFRMPVSRFQKDADARVYFDVSAFQTMALVWAMVEHDRVSFKGGMLAFERNNRYPGDDPSSQSFVGGKTAGLFPGVWTGAQEFGVLEDTWRHEFVHAIQSLQFDVAEPSFAFLTNETDARPGRPRRLIRFEHLNLGLVNLASAAIEAPTDTGWREIEAYRIANDIEAGH